MKKRTKVPIWELALLLALAVTLLWGAVCVQRQDALQQKLIRLHVLANSDDAVDQELKLLVRDRVLTLAQEILTQAADREQAQRQLTEALPRLRQAAEETLAAAGCDDSVEARLEEADFPTRDYDGFSLPAGRYLSLRIIIGEGQGQNWWCVVFPPLCSSAACSWQDTAQSGGLDGEDVSLMAEEDGYVLRFRSVELWEMLRSWLGR